jgi:hypothetical protein
LVQTPDSSLQVAVLAVGPAPLLGRRYHRMGSRTPKLLRAWQNVPGGELTSAASKKSLAVCACSSVTIRPHTRRTAIPGAALPAPGCICPG